jgi:hypothetical protein
LTRTATVLRRGSPPPRGHWRLLWLAACTSGFALGFALAYAIARHPELPLQLTGVPPGAFSAPTNGHSASSSSPRLRQAPSLAVEATNTPLETPAAQNRQLTVVQSPWLPSPARGGDRTGLGSFLVSGIALWTTATVGTPPEYASRVTEESELRRRKQDLAELERMLARRAAIGPPPWVGQRFQFFGGRGSSDGLTFMSCRGRDFTPMASPAQSAAWYVRRGSAPLDQPAQAALLRELEAIEDERATRVATILAHIWTQTGDETKVVSRSGYAYIIAKRQLWFVSRGQDSGVDRVLDEMATIDDRMQSTIQSHVRDNPRTEK